MMNVDFNRRYAHETIEEGLNVKQKRGPVDSAYCIIANQLGYGGKITDFTETSITAVANVMGNIDTMTFHGTREEIERIWMAIRLYYELNPHRVKVLQEFLEKNSSTIPEFLKKPQNLGLVMPLTNDFKLLTNIMLIGAFVDNDFESAVQNFGKTNTDQLVAALELLYEDKSGEHTLQSILQ